MKLGQSTLRCKRTLVSTQRVDENIIFALGRTVFEIRGSRGFPVLWVCENGSRFLHIWKVEVIWIFSSRSRGASAPRRGVRRLVRRRLTCRKDAQGNFFGGNDPSCTDHTRRKRTRRSPVAAYRNRNRGKFGGRGPALGLARTCLARWPPVYLGRPSDDCRSVRVHAYRVRF
jgi:hypothetical protein